MLIVAHSGTRWRMLAALLVTTFLLAFVPTVNGQTAEGDHPLFSRFTGSTIVNYRVEPDTNYRLVLGNMRRVAGRVVAEREQRLRGTLTRITYEIPQGFGAADAIAFYQEQAALRGYTMLYTCSGRDCGNSNYWANEVFDDRSLYGPERGQSYFVWRAETEHGAGGFLVLYVVTRANRRQFTHLEILETDPVDATPAETTALQGLLDAGGVRLEGLTFNAQGQLSGTAVLGDVAVFLRENPSVAIYVVAHLSAAGDLETLLARSQRRADLIRERLIQLGIDPGRVLARGVGPLAPLCPGQDCLERVELVLH